MTNSSEVQNLVYCRKNFTNVSGSYFLRKSSFGKTLPHSSYKAWYCHNPSLFSLPLPHAALPSTCEAGRALTPPLVLSAPVGRVQGTVGRCPGQEFQNPKPLIRDENEILSFLSLDAHMSKILEKTFEWWLWQIAP